MKILPVTSDLPRIWKSISVTSLWLFHLFSNYQKISTFWNGLVPSWNFGFSLHDYISAFKYNLHLNNKYSLKLFVVVVVFPCTFLLIPCYSVFMFWSAVFADNEAVNDKHVIIMYCKQRRWRLYKMQVYKCVFILLTHSFSNGYLSAKMWAHNLSAAINKTIFSVLLFLPKDKFNSFSLPVVGEIKMLPSTSTPLYKGGILIFEKIVPRPDFNHLFITKLSLARQSNQQNVLPSLFWENLYGIISKIWIFFVLKVVKWVWMKLVKLDSTPCNKMGKKSFFGCPPWYKITHLWFIFGLKSIIYMDLFTVFRQF